MSSSGPCYFRMDGALKLTSRGEVAIRTLVELARIEAEEPREATAAELAERCGTSVHFVEQVLIALRVCKLVHSRRGRLGGYRLARDAVKITVGEVLRQVDGPLSPAPCAWPDQQTTCSWCRPGPPCSLAPLWQEVSNAIACILDSRTVATLAMETGPIRDTAALIEGERQAADLSTHAPDRRR
jgi:Rrf2 family protein